MIHAQHRFHGYNSINGVYKRGKTVRGNLLAIKYIENGRSSYRAAVVVSKKVSKQAVVRNRIRRRIYEILRANEERLTGSYDIIMTVFDERVATIAHTKLKEVIEGQLQQTGIVREQ